MKSTSGRDTLALVESPAQLLHLLEWCHAEGTADRTALALLTPNDSSTRAQLRSMVDYAEEEGIATCWYEPRASLRAALHAFGELRSQVADARTLVIGDPFSGVVQALLPHSGAREAVIVDDGTATLEFAAQLAAGEPLRRWHAGGVDPLRGLLARAARDFFRTRRTRLFTVMTVTGVPGSRVERHSYEWTRRRFGPVRTAPGLDVIGSSLVETGVVRPEAYLEAVVALGATSRGGRYFAHRREDPAKLDRLAGLSGLRVVRPSVPLEVELRRGPVARRLASFPSSVGYTLPLVLAGSEVRITVQPLPEAMFTANATHRARSFLAKVGEDVRVAAAGLAGPGPTADLTTSR
ncbi:MAG TPA: hypothetical protein PKV13_02535 [Propionicimonas sp.]|nr:hypothetical protein [Propionicimonas sp.]HRA05480.1 hypothetical protein [Propionicimonas sp.]